MRAVASQVLKVAIGLGVGAAFFAAPAFAGTMSEVVDICSDPLSTGLQKRDLFAISGWAPLASDATPALTDLATALVIGFTMGMPDLEERFGLASVLAGNFAAMTDKGAMTLWSRDGAVLALNIDKTPEGGEHMACYFAMPPSDETFEIARVYGEPEVLPELELMAVRFDETAIRFQPDVEYQMFSTWTRLTSDPLRTPLTDAYRLERIEIQPK
ncbi:hypothetical protein [Phaeovulum sp.]|uniref:hypothetical protein n=1 Tax=Phaeovulum sp. TaxID=2934796 RepID=UPI003561A902